MLSPSLFLPYLVLAVVATVVAARRASTPWRKRGAVVGTIFAFWVLGHIDDIIGGTYHQWLCHTEAGFKVYKEVSLPAQFYDTSGKPKFFTSEGLDRNMLAPFIRFDRWDASGFSKFFVTIDKRHVRVVDERNATLYGEQIDFARWPSDFLPALAKERATGCFSLQDESSQWREWYRGLFGSP